jgi:four helix bundle protein
VTNAEFKEELEQRTKRFAVALVNWLDMLPERRAVNVLVYQLAKSGTAMGANYREANKAESKADFSHKISIVEKESNEAVFWFEVLLESQLLPAQQREAGQPLYAEAGELLKLFSSISRSSRHSKPRH